MANLRLSNLLIGCVVVLGFLTKGYSSITCYHCNSAYDPRCGDPFDPYSLGTVNCSMKDPPEHLVGMGDATICRKNTQKVYGVTRVVRGCGWIENDPPRDEKVCMRRTGTHDVAILYCVCKGDMCNGASQMTLTITNLLAMVVASVGVLTKTILL